MGLFDNIFNTIGSGLSSVGHSLGSDLTKLVSPVVKPFYNTILKPAFDTVIKPAYNQVVKPVGKAIGHIAQKGLETGENLITGGMDFSQKFVDKGRQGILNVEDGAVNLTKLLSNPLVLIGGGILALVVVSKI